MDIFSHGELASKDDLKREIELLKMGMNGKLLPLQWMIGSLLALAVAIFVKQFY